MTQETYSVRDFGTVQLILEEGKPLFVRQPHEADPEDMAVACDYLAKHYEGCGMTARETDDGKAVMWHIVLGAFDEALHTEGLADGSV